MRSLQSYKGPRWKERAAGCSVPFTLLHGTGAKVAESGSTLLREGLLRNGPQPFLGTEVLASLTGSHLDIPYSEVRISPLGLATTPREYWKPLQKVLG